LISLRAHDDIPPFLNSVQAVSKAAANGKRYLCSHCNALPDFFITTLHLLTTVLQVTMALLHPLHVHLP
jgi:hypothetical protein